METLETLETTQKKSSLLSPFYFVEPWHPFYAKIQSFQRALDTDPLYRRAKEQSAMAGRPGGPEKIAVHSEIKGRLLPDEGWELNRFYWSFQYWDKSLPQGFHAITLYYSVKTGETYFYQFPEDPYLSEMTDYFKAHLENDAEVRVLRYVPLRRFTFGLTGFDGLSDPVIAKFKRKSRFQKGFDLLRIVSEGGKQNHPSFSLPAPIGLDVRHRLYYQETKKGADLSTLLCEGNAKILLNKVGQLHADLHKMEIEGLPVWDLNAFMQEIQSDIAWIGFFFPAEAPFLKDLLGFLLERPPEISPDDFTFCHGDFVCSQLLKLEAAWAVIDFDLAKAGDRHLEIAMLIASLRYDVPLFEQAVSAYSGTIPPMLQEAEASYLAGYESTFKRTLDRKRLLWYRMRAEIYYLALMIKKDRFDPNAFRYGMDLLSQLKDRFTKEYP